MCVGPLEWYSCPVDIVHDMVTGEEVIVVRLAQPYYLSQLRYGHISSRAHYVLLLLANTYTYNYDKTMVL